MNDQQKQNQLQHEQQQQRRRRKRHLIDVPPVEGNEERIQWGNQQRRMRGQTQHREQQRQRFYHDHHHRRRKLFNLLARENRLRILDYEDTNNDNIDDDGIISKAECEMAGLIPFVSSFPQQYGYENALGMALAIKHLNEGNYSLVPQLKGLRETCPIHFTISLVDTERDPKESFREADLLTRSITDFEFLTDVDVSLDRTSNVTTVYAEKVTDEIGADVSDINGNLTDTFKHEVLSIDQELQDAIALLEETSTNLPGSRNRLPCALIGAFDSECSKTTALITGMRGFPQISPASTTSSLDNDVEYPLFGRTMPNDKTMTKAFVQYLHDELNVRHIYVIFESHPYTRSIARGIRDAIRELHYQPGRGADVDDNDMYMYEKMIEGTGYGQDIHSGLKNLANIIVDDDNDYRIDESELDFTPSNNTITPNNTVGSLVGGGVEDAVQSLKRSKFRFVVSAVKDTSLSDALMFTAYQYGVAGVDDYYWWSFDTLRNILEDRTLPKNSVLAKAYNGFGACFGFSNTNSSTYKNFVEQAHELKREFYQKNPENWKAGRWSFKPPPGGKLAEDDWFPDDQTQFSYVTPPFSYDAAILIGLSACREVEAKQKASNADINDKDTTYDDLYLTGNEFFNRMKVTPFIGVTGNVTLDSTGNRLGDSINYAIENYRSYDVDDDDGNNTTSGSHSSFVTFHYKVTDLYTSGQWNNIRPFVYPSGNTTLPEYADIPPVMVKYNPIDLWTQWIAYSLFIIIMSATIGFATWTFLNREVRIVRASQPFFLYLLCVGIAVFACAIIPMTFDHFNCDQTFIACNAAFWLNIFGFGIIFSALFAKTLRINIIMKNAAKFRRVKLTPRDVMYPVVGVFIFNLIMCSFMTRYKPITYNVYEQDRDEFGRHTLEYGRCEYGNSMPFIVPTVVVNLLLVGFALFQAWRARNLSTEFAESKYIANSLGISLVSSLLVFPVMIVVNEQPDATTFVSTSLVFVLASSVLFSLFVPKIMHQHREINGSVIAGNFTSTNNGVTASSGSLFHSQFQRVDSSSTLGSSSGEKIITTKSSSALAKEMSTLQRELAVLKKRERTLYERNIELENKLLDSSMSIRVPNSSRITEVTDSSRIKKVPDSSQSTDDVSECELLSNSLHDPADGLIGITIDHGVGNSLETISSSFKKTPSEKNISNRKRVSFQPCLSSAKNECSKKPNLAALNMVGKLHSSPTEKQNFDQIENRRDDEKISKLPCDVLVK